MAVEILSVSLSDESIEKIANRVAMLLTASEGNYPGTQSNHPSSETHRTQSGGVSQGQADPWTGAPPADTGQWPQQGQAVPSSPQSGYQGQQQGPPPQQENQAPQAPRCLHGEMRYVPAGFSKSSGKAYQAFYGCPAPRGQEQCKSERA